VFTVIHRQSQIRKVARERIRARVVADRDLHALAQELSKAGASEFGFTLLDVVIAGLRLACECARDSDFVSWLDLALTLMSFDLLQDARMLRSRKLVVNLTLVLQCESLGVCALLLSAEVRNLQESTVRECHDETIALLEARPGDIDRRDLSLGGPNKPHIFVDKQEVVKGAQNCHEAWCFKLRAILRLHEHTVLRTLIIFKNVCSELVKMVRQHTAWCVIKAALEPNLPLVSNDEDGLLARNEYFFGVRVAIVMCDHEHWLLTEIAPPFGLDPLPSSLLLTLSLLLLVDIISRRGLESHIAITLNLKV